MTVPLLRAAAPEAGGEGRPSGGGEGHKGALEGVWDQAANRTEGLRLVLLLFSSTQWNCFEGIPQHALGKRHWGSSEYP